MSEIKITKAGQHLRCFEAPSSYAKDKRTLTVRIMDYADEHDLVIEKIDFMNKPTPQAARIAYVMFSKRQTGTCADCQGECPASDYLCHDCRRRS